MENKKAALSPTMINAIREWESEVEFKSAGIDRVNGDPTRATMEALRTRGYVETGFKLFIFRLTEEGIDLRSELLDS